jgi:glycosyltransferase involved in cell wall biosynthesis
MAKHLMYLTAEEWPTFRVDINSLFGRELPRNGITCDLVTDLKAGAPEASRWSGGALRLCPPSASKAAHHIRKLIHLSGQAARAQHQDYDAIQVRDMPVVAVLALCAARLRGLKFMYWMSYPQSEGQVDRARQRGMGAGLRYWFPLLQGLVGQWLLYKLVMPLADHVFVQSEEMARNVHARGIARDKLTPVPMAVDPDRADPGLIAPSDDPRLAGRKVVVYLGSLDRARQIEILMDSMLLVRQQHPDALLVLAGDADDADQRARITQLVAEARFQDAVVWTGWLPMAQAWAYVRAADVAVSPIPRNFLMDCSSPTKAVEYMSLGVPAVVSDNPDQRQLIEASGGGLCAPYTAADFAQAIGAVLAMAPAERQAMGERGRRHVARHRNYAQLAVEVARVYERVLA